jgi:hypothetical protein
LGCSVFVSKVSERGSCWSCFSYNNTNTAFPCVHFCYAKMAGLHVCYSCVEENVSVAYVVGDWSQACAKSRPANLCINDAARSITLRKATNRTLSLRQSVECCYRQYYSKLPNCALSVWALRSIHFRRTPFLDLTFGVSSFRRT